MKLKPILLAGVLLSAGAAVAFAEAPEGGRDCHGERGEHRERMIDGLDTDNDGKISKSEARAGSDGHFDRIDANNDGAITPDEAERLFRPQPDANGDGKVSPEEFAALGEARFAKRDTNNDGVLADEELKPPHRGRHGRHGGDDGAE